MGGEGGGGRRKSGGGVEMTVGPFGTEGFTGGFLDLVLDSCSNPKTIRRWVRGALLLWDAVAFATIQSAGIVVLVEGWH